MRKAILILVALLVACLAFSQPTVSLVYDVVFSDHRTNAVVYNANTGHLLVAGTAVTILDASDGTTKLGTLTDPAGFTEQYFTLTVAEDGVIFGYGYPSGNFYRWADESAAPTTESPTGLMGTVRHWRAYGSGVDTRIYATGGGDNNLIQLGTTADGSTFNFVNLIDAPAAKSAVTAIAPGFETVFGIQPWGSDYNPADPEPTYQQGFPRRFDFVGGNWQVNTSFIPEDPDPDPANHVSYSVGGDYGDGYLWVFYYNNETVWALNENTGSQEAEYVSPYDLFYAGSLHVDTVNDRVYWGATNSGTPDGGYIGCLSYSFATPTPSPETDARGIWTLYE